MENDHLLNFTSSTFGLVKLWFAPDPGIIKYNFDIMFNLNTHNSVSGIIFRNKEGKIKVACTHQNMNIADPETTKAKAGL